MGSSQTAAGKILVVDDDPAFTILICRFLEVEGYAVQKSESGETGFGVAQSMGPDLILLDYNLPDVQGPEVVGRLRGADVTRETPILMLTGEANNNAIEEAFDAGVDDYLVKPAPRPLLMHRVKSMLEIKKSREEAQAARQVEKQHEAMMQDLREAETVQQGLLPDLPAKWDGWQTTGCVLECGHVGGDMVDILVEGERSFSIVADVSGHGIGAALMASTIRSELRGLLVNHSIEHALAELNQRLATKKTGKYACVAIVEMSGTKCRIANAGLPPVTVINGPDDSVEVQASGVPVGLLTDQEYDAVDVEVRQGGRIVLMTDGLTEPFGLPDNAQDALTRLALPEVGADPMDPDDIMKLIQDYLKKATEDIPDDDATMLLIERPHAAGHSFVPSIDNIRGAVAWAMNELEDAPMEFEFGLTEAVTNAVVHGALGVSSDGREDGVEDFISQIDTKSRKLAVEPNSSIHMWIDEADGARAVWIEWPGQPCPVDKREPDIENFDPLSASGRGMHIIYDVSDEIRWRDDGRAMALVRRKSE